MEEKLILEKLKKKYKEKDTTNFNISDFIYAVGSPLDAIMYLKLFWPDFIEINDMVFLKDTFEDEDDLKLLKETLEKHENDKKKTEESFNYVEVSYLFVKSYETTADDDFYLAEQLVEMWTVRLKLLFPERNFIVRLCDLEETAGEVGIIFHQI